MKNIVIILLLFVACAWGQEPQVHKTNFAAVGLSYYDSLAGTAGYGRLLSDKLGTYNFWHIDAIPTSLKPVEVATNVSTGILQHVLTIKGCSVYIPGTAGISWKGSNAGWAWGTGALLTIPTKYGTILPNVRVAKSSVNNNSNYQLLLGVMFGGGWN